MTTLQAIVSERDCLRVALSKLCGVETLEEVAAMELVLRTSPAPMEDKAVMIDAMHALKKPLTSAEPVEKAIQAAREYYTANELWMEAMGRGDEDERQDTSGHAAIAGGELHDALKALK